MKMLKLLVLSVFITVSAKAGYEGIAIDMNLDQIQLDDSILNHSLVERTNEQKYLVIEFFQTTCGPCVYNQGLWPSILKEVGENTDLRVIAIDRNRNNVIKYVTKKP